MRRWNVLAVLLSGGIQAADLALAGNVSAIVAFNDLTALGVLSRLAARRVAVDLLLGLQTDALGPRPPGGIRACRRS